jgi:glycine/D-amino acid oxidase-like deaminating enzyme
MHDVLVVGGGIFGSVIARHLRELGMSVLLVDDARKGRGSAPAGCVIKPSWVSSMSRSDVEGGLELLHTYYGVRQVEFLLRPVALKTVTAYRVEPTAIMSRVGMGRVDGTVAWVRDYCHSAMVAFRSGPAATVEARWVVVAAGLWTEELCPWARTWGRWGWAFRGLPVREPVIDLWAPYKQIVAFNMDDGMSWAGDGSALVEKSFHQAQRYVAARARVGRYVPEITSTLAGVRPYAEAGKDPCLVAPQGRIIAVTGGAKNGTIAAAWAARRVEEIVR